MEKLKKITDKNIYVFLLLAIVTLVVYGNIINGPFIYDDNYMIVMNEDIRSLTHFFDYFSESATSGFDYTSNLYRPLTNLVNALTYAVFGLMSPFYHLRSVLIHIINGFLVFLLFKKLSFKNMTSFIIALLFLLHPTQVESVSYIAGLPDVLHAMFILLGLYLYSDLFKEKNKNIVLKCSLIVLLLILALLTKESSVIFLPLAALINVYQWENYSKRTKMLAVKMLSVLGSITAIYLYLKLTVFSFREGHLGLLDNPEHLYAKNIHMRIAQFFVAVYEYLKIIFFPANLTFEKSFDFYNCWNKTCFYLSLLKDFKGLFGVGAILLGTVFSVISLKRKRVFFFGFMWFLIALAPVSNILIPTNAPYKEHWLYIPIIGIFVILGALIERLVLDKKYLNRTVCVLIAIFILFGIRIIQRNEQWKNPERFFLHEIHHKPDLGRIRADLGYVYYEQGKLEAAEDTLSKAIELYDKDDYFYFFMGKVKEAKNELSEAENYYSKALELNPNQKEAKKSLEKLK